MKKAIITFLQKPILVTCVSLVVAVSVGIYEYQVINAVPAYQFVKVTSGSIASPVTSDGNSQHVSLSFPVGGRVQSVSVKVGDKVTKGMTLATLDPESTLGAMTQAQAGYASAKANYEKVLNGATSANVDVANSAIAVAEQNLDHSVSNTYTQIESMIKTSVDSMYLYPNSNEPQFQVSFSDPSTNSNVVLSPQDINQKLNLGNERVTIGNLLSSWKNATSTNENETIDMTLKNLTAVKSYLNAVSDGLSSITYDTKYQSYFDKHKADISTAKATVDTLINTIQNNQLAVQTAKASANVVTTGARPEDVAVAKAQMDTALGALQIAQAAYNSHIIAAPGDGTVTAVKVNVGEISSPNSTVIELTGNNFAKTVSLMVPRDTIINIDGKTYVLVKASSVNSQVIQKEVITGARDDQNIEIVSGLSADDEVVIR
jgi:HlyD family secretion protein